MSASKLESIAAEAPSAPILIVDDEAAVRVMLGRVLSSVGHQSVLAANAEEARACLARQEFALMLCDLYMPGESGMELIKYVLAQHPETAVVMITAESDPDTAESALNMGVYGYIIKPYKTAEVIINVSNALKRRRLEIDSRIHKQVLENTVRERTQELQSALANLQGAMDGIIRAMASLVEMRDPYTAGHQHRVAILAKTIAEEMGLPEEGIATVEVAGTIHDLGKISVPAEILVKPGRLNELEFGLIKYHPQGTSDILKDIKFPWPIAQVALQHHERMDGSGYPQGLRGEEIALEARILAVADVVEAMASHRPYRAALGVDKALQEVSGHNARLYDPDVVAACVKVFKEREFAWAN
ncbi:MAG: HD domain-containing phosphohydrolase [Thermodesulfobacteriota bacterium]